MTELIEVLQWVQRVAFVGLALVCLRLWQRQRTPAAGWVAATFATLAVVVLVGAVTGEDAKLPGWFAGLILATLVLFPYCLHRFMTALVDPPRWIRRAAVALTAGIIVWSFLLPPFPEPGGPLTGWFRAYVAGLLVQWSVLSLSVSIRLWRAGRGEAGLPRRRMRLLALAASGLNVALVLTAAAGGGAETPAIELTVEVLALAGAGLFFVAFAPPLPLRMLWRRREEAALRDAAEALSAATSIEVMTSGLLPHVAPIFGGNAALLADVAGTPLAVFGMELDEAEEIGRGLASQGTAQIQPGLLALPLRSGWLVVKATPYTPFFGRDELELLSSIGVFVDLASERARLFEGERQARVGLERANTELEAFLYSVSHDLKSPLVSLSGYLEYLTEDFGEALGPAGREYLDRMSANATYMQDLIQDLLELSRVGRIQMEPAQVDLQRLVAEIATEAERGHPGLHVEIHPLPSVLINPLRARQLFTNLLDNAANHGGRDDLHVRVTATETADGGVQVAVADDGIGVPAGYREKVFGVFERLDGRRGKGTGIGLAICRKIAEHMGGRIWIAPSDEGADVRIELPAYIVLGWNVEVTT
jgi:signal transduction histidine kinase